MERAGAIERASYIPDAATRAATPPPTPVPAIIPARPESAPLVLLIHDGRSAAVRGAVETGMAEALAGGDRLLALHALLPHEPAASLRDVLLRHHPVGAVLTPSLADRDDLVPVLEEIGIRHVRLGPSGDLAFDERHAAASVVEWLASRGHVRIGLVAGPETSVSAQQRELGYLDALAERGLDRGPVLLVPGDDTFESGIAAGRLLLEISPRPTAILACNDEMAAGVLHAAAQAGVPVPDALSVVGFDDTPLARRTLPPLTSVHLPWQHIGRDAARRLTGSAPPAAAEPFDVILAERDSVRAIE